MSRSIRAGLTRKAGCVAVLAAVGAAAAAFGQTRAVIPADVNGQTTPTPDASARPATQPAELAPGGTAAPSTPAAAAPAGAGVGAANQGGISGAPATQAVVPQDAGTAPSAVTLPTAATPIVPGPEATASPTASTTPAATTSPGAIVAIPPAPSTEAAPEIPTGKASPKDGNGYPITELKIGYKFPNASLPPISDLLNSQITLGEVDDGYVAPRQGVRAVTVRLGDIGKVGPKKIYRSGIAAIYGDILHYLNDRNIIGVFVVVDPDDIKTAPGETIDVDKDVDVRNGRTSLQLVVVTSTVKQVRTVEIGDISTPNRVNDPRFDGIRNHSPLQPSDLLRKDVLDDYRLRLDRVQGRRVDVAISGTNDAGEVYLDYLIAEARPWYAYAQLSNTGTSQTSTWRERFGFVDTQLTNHDDVLSLDYSTADFSKSHGFTGSYEFPVLDFDRMRDRVYGTWNEFTASDVGQNLEKFTGSSWSVGDELIMNIFQKRELFIDAIAGFKFQGVENNDATTATTGRALFFDPYLGLRLERVTDVASTTGQVTLIGYQTSANANDVAGLGRLNVTGDPVVLQYDFMQSFYLEPLLDPQRFAAGSSTLANEIAISMKGQWAFNNRLFPQAQDVAGGLYSVRGYPESIVAGDSVIIGSAEYRFHVPRIFPVVEDPTKTPFLWDKAFRYSPQQPYGKPDWDLILRAFFDVAEVVNSDRQTLETDATLAGTGVGAELQLKQNFNLRVDWGVPLTGVKNEVQSGSSRFHISTTFLY